jgi:hypothetical protein
MPNHTPTTTRPVSRWAIIAALVLTATACKPGSAATQTASAKPAATIQTDPTISLAIQPEDTGAHDNRDEWGDWKSQGKGCDTRETVLRRDGRDIQLGPNCRITSGVWISPYDGLELRIPSQVQIDHVVPTREAARSGARNWPREQRAGFYNDLANLTAVSATSNTSKGDSDPGRWMPTNTAARCDYVQKYIATKTRYGLTVDQAEHDALVHVLTTCPGQLQPGR